MKKRLFAAIVSAVMLITGVTACSTENNASISSTDTSVSESSSAPETSAATTAGESFSEPSSADETSSEESSSVESDTSSAETTTAAVTTTTTAAATTAAVTTTTTTVAATTTTTTTAATTTTKSTTKTTTTTTKKPEPAAPTGSSEALSFATKMMPGWNLGNQLEASSGGTPSETAWGNPVITEKLIKTVKAQGFKSIRIPVSYLSKIGSGPNYTVDKAWLDRIAEVVDLCVDNGLYAIINIHGDGYHSVTGGWLLCDNADQKTVKDKFGKVWAQIADRFKDYDEHLVFESMNEVFDGTYGGINKDYYSNINAYNQIFVDTVRASGGNNAKRYLLVPGWNTDIDATAGDQGFVLPTDKAKRLMVSVHYYAPWEFCLKEDAPGIWRWGEAAKKLGKTIKRNNEDYVDSQFDKLVDKFISKGVPVVIGEYGSIDKTYSDKNNTAYRAYFAEYVNYAAAKRGIVTVLWDNGYNGKNGFGVFNRKDCTVTQPEIIAGIMKGVKANYTIKAPTV